MDSILSKIAEYTIEPIGRLLGRQVGYVIHCKTNLQKLKDQVEELKTAREATENQVAEAKTKGEKVQPDVQLWLTKVGEITAQADALLKDESQAKLKCLHGFCPNLTVRYQLSRKSTKLVEEVVEHSGKRGLISQVSCGNLRKEVWDITNRDYHAFQSRMSKVKEIMDHLKDSKTERMGVYGMGGVGKTTLVKEIYKQASEAKLFDDVVILLDVKKNPDLEAIQKKIMEKLDMKIEQDETIDGTARRLCGRIQDKKILVILDDVQEKIDLEDLGLPRLPTCKILLTFRTREVFDEMRADKVFQLDLLGKEDAWNLFVEMAGGVINQNGDIRAVAMEVAERCGGLPLLVVTVASALKQKNKLPEWKDALRRLKGFDKEKLTEKAYLALEWSYDQLDDKELKPLFLLCGLMVQQKHIIVSDLFKYAMGLSLFQNVNSLEEARNALDSQLGKLKDSCLLLDSDVDHYVRMHDLVCHVANRIAYRDQHVLSVEYDGELKEWPNKDFLRKCTKIHLRPSKIPPLPEIPLECPELEFFYLDSGDDDIPSVEFPSDFFREMQKLKVLDLTRMRMPSLPLSLQYLKKLQTLCLDQCMLGDITLLGQLSNLEILSFLYSEIKELPKEIGQLTRLRLLDLSCCSQLEVIPPTVISSLVRLEDMRMRNSFNKWEVEGEGSHMPSLSELKHLSELSALEIHIPNADVLPAKLFSHKKLERFNIFIGDPWEKLMAETTLNTLKLKLTKSNNKLDEGLKLLLKRSEDLSLDETEVVIINQLNTEDFEHLKHLQLQNSIGFIDIVKRKVVFPNLSTLRVRGCDNLRFLFSFSMARSLVQLTQLKISECELMQEIVSSTRECGEANMDNMFCKLKVLDLEKLPNLIRVIGTENYIEFSSLEELKIKDCNELVEFIGDEVAMSSKDTIIRHKIEQRVLEEEDNHEVKKEIVVQYFLFNEKVGFPSLEKLFIEGIRKVKAIWHIQLAQNSFRRLREIKVRECDSLINFFPPSFMGRLNASSPNHDQLIPFYCPNLDSIHIYECDSLKNIFPATMARGLQQLTQLSVDSCFGMEEIVGEEVEGVLETTPPQFVFPKVTSVALKNLPQLRRFYPRLHTSYWPLLKQLEMVECYKVEILAAEFSIFREKCEMNSLISPQPFFITDEDPFPNLEDLTLTANEIWNGPAQSELVFAKLKSIRFYGNCAPFSNQASVIFLDRLQNLETIEMWLSSSSSEEIFVNRGISSSRGEIRDDDDAVGSGTLPRVRILKLLGMDKLMHLGNDNSQSAAAAAGPVLFPNLEILEVFACNGLKSVGSSSAISFRNLTTLTVTGCDGLEYLSTHSVAESLVQLTTLEVRLCESILVIVRSNDQDDDDDAAPAATGNVNEIAFSRLQHLELYGLPRLQGFCSRNCTVKFPSSMTLNVVACPIKLKISPDGVLLTEKDPEDQDQDETVAETKDEDEDETAQRNPEILSEGPPAS